MYRFIISQNDYFLQRVIPDNINNIKQRQKIIHEDISQKAHILSTSGIYLHRDDDLGRSKFCISRSRGSIRSTCPENCTKKNQFLMKLPLHGYDTTTKMLYGQNTKHLAGES